MAITFLTNEDKAELEQKIADLEASGVGLSDTARTLLMTVLKSGVYTSDQSANLAALEEALKTSGGSGGSDTGGDSGNSGDSGETETVTYTITNNLTNCTNSNNATNIEENAAYTAVIAAVDGCELESVSVTMGGSAVTVSGGTISIQAVTGNIVITAVATAAPTEKTLDHITATYPSVDAETGMNVADLSGFVVTAFYNDGSSEVVTEYTVSADSTTIASGTNTVTVSYGGKNASVTINGITLTRYLHSDVEATLSVSLVYNGNNVAPLVMKHNFDNANYTCALSGKRVRKITVYAKTAGLVTVGKTDLTAYGQSEPLMLNPVQYDMVAGANTIYVDISLGEHETLAFQHPTNDTGKLGYINQLNEMTFGTADQFKPGNFKSSMSFQGSIYIQ